jgi:two-component system, cell cycle response regulator DivK
VSDVVVLLVEDQEDNRVLARKLLERAGFLVLEATDGRQALDEAATRLPDLVLLDISLPGMDGLTVARRLRESAADKTPLIVALTAHAMASDRAKALESGCHEFMTKPIDVPTFIPTLRRILEHHRT